MKHKGSADSFVAGAGVRSGDRTQGSNRQRKRSGNPDLARGEGLPRRRPSTQLNAELRANRSQAPAVVLPAWRRLHVQAALLAVPLLLLLGAGMFLLLKHYSTQAALEASQRMNLGLAQYVVDHQAPGLLDEQGRPNLARVDELAKNVMMINPSVEVYLLSGKGKVLAHALDGVQGVDPVGSAVDLGPVRDMIANPRAESLRLPLLGTDPRAAQQTNTFSAAPLGQAGQAPGYLYIVLNGNEAQAVVASLDNSSAVQAMGLSVLLAVSLAGVVLWLSWRHLTRPLHELTQEVRAFRGEEHAERSAEHSGEIGMLRLSFLQMRERIAQQFQRLEDADRQRRELVSNISHDLRTPLSSIRGYVETVMLRGDELDAATRAQHLRTALRHVDLLGKRTADLFELSKLDAGRVKPQHEVFCLAELLQDVVQGYRLPAQERGVQITLAAGGHTQAQVLADIALIERVLQNLIDNALRYTPAGGDVTVGLAVRGDFMEVSVRDNGRGIEAEHLPHIFERYWRANEADESRSNTSSGLGLAIVKRILDLHGTAVRVRSEFKRGTQFDFLLPLRGVA